MITLREYPRGDSIMPKKAKSNRTKTKAKTKTKTKMTSTKKPKAKLKTQKKAKMETAKLRLSKPPKVVVNLNNDIDVAQITKQPEQLKANTSPINNYWLEVDGRLKSEYPTADAASKAGLELKRKYPHIRVAVFNNKEQTRTVVELA
jgi:hypothetical protein